ncbi:MAG: peptide deformylase [Nitrospiraceae bacterium]
MGTTHAQFAMENQLVSIDTPILREEALDVKFPWKGAESLNALASRLWDACARERGLGLAANQIGIPLKMAVISTPTRKLAVVNPRILVAKGACILVREGCLSLPGKEFMVPRYMSLRVAYNDLTGKLKVLDLVGLDAQVFQHELDHLRGRLISDYKELQNV